MQVQLTLSHASAMIQVGLRVPTPFAERRSQASCEFLAHARSRSLPCTGFQFLLSAQACEHLVAAIEFGLVCVCVRVSGADLGGGGGGGHGGSCPPTPPSSCLTLPVIINSSTPLPVSLTVAKAHAKRRASTILA